MKESNRNIITLAMLASLIVLIAFANLTKIRKENAYLQELEVKEKRKKEIIERKEDSIKRANDSIAEARRIMNEQRLEQMATTVMHSTIFAGLHFGDDPQTVQSAIKNNRTIQVPVYTRVHTVHIKDYDAKYYQGRLASLTLYADESNLIDPLYALFTTKYGEGVDYQWIFSNCKIAIKLGHRRKYERWERSLSPDPYLYYDDYRGRPSSTLTDKASFIKIIYEDYNLLKLIEQQKIVDDSLMNAKRQKAIEEEKELARKLATEPATNI